MSCYQMEQLESRLMLAASVDFRNQGTLVIRGDAADDTIEVVGKGATGAVEVRWDADGDGAVDQVRNYTGVKNITIRGGAGNDDIAIEDVQIAGNLKIFGNKGDDYGTIEGSTIGGRTNFNGQQGQDTFVDLGGNSFGFAPKFTSELDTPKDPTEPTDPTDPTDPVKELEADNDTYSTHDNFPITVNLLENDVTAADTFLTEIAGNGHTETEYDSLGNLNITLEHGIAVVNANGSMTYTPNSLTAGQTVTDTLTYTLTDVLGNTSTATVTIHVDGNDAHAPQDDYILTNILGTGLPFDLFENDSGLPRGEVSYFTMSSLTLYSTTPMVAADGSMEIISKAKTGGLNAGDRIGTISVSASGEFTFTADQDLASKLLYPYSTTFTVEYYVNNGLEEYGGDHATVMVAIQGVPA